MKRVIAQVVANGVGSDLIVDRRVGGNEVKINGIPYEVLGCGDQQNHEIWTEGEKPIPGWVRGYKVTLSSDGLYRVGDKITIEEPDPEPEPVPEVDDQDDEEEVPEIPPDADTAPSGVESPLDNPQEVE